MSEASMWDKIMIRWGINQHMSFCLRCINDIVSNYSKTYIIFLGQWIIWKFGGISQCFNWTTLNEHRLVILQIFKRSDNNISKIIAVIDSFMQTWPPWLCHSWVQSSCTQNWISKDHLLRSHFLSDNQSWYIFLFCCDHLIHSVCSKCRSCQFLKISSFLCYVIDNSDTSLRSYRGPLHFIKGFLILV